MDVFLYNCSYQEGEEGGSSAKQWSVPKVQDHEIEALWPSCLIYPCSSCQFQDQDIYPTETFSVIYIVNLIFFVVLFVHPPIDRICEIHCCDFGAPANFFDVINDSTP